MNMSQKTRLENITSTLTKSLALGVRTMSMSSTLRTDLGNLFELLHTSGPRTETGMVRCNAAVSQLMVEMIAKERFEQGEPWDNIVRDFPVLDPDVPVRDIIEEVKVKVEDDCLVTDLGVRCYCNIANMTREDVIKTLEAQSTLLLTQQYIYDRFENKPINEASISEPDVTFQVILDRKTIAQTAILFYSWD